ncbi:MAG: PAS domain S-box protein, partial [Haliea sp.]
LQAADQRLELAGSRLRVLEAERRLDEDTARLMLREQLRELAFVRAIWVLDRSGRIIYDTDTGNVGVSLADREYFQVYQQRPATGFHISAPVRSRTTGTWLIAVSRPLRSAGGAVTGVIVAAVEPPYFERAWGDIDLGTDGAIGLMRLDGVLMLRSPAGDARMDQSFASLPLFTDHLPRSPAGKFKAVSTFDNIERTTAYRRLSAYPQLVVYVGRTSAAMLDTWNRFATVSLSIWLTAMAGLGLLSLLLYRNSMAREHTELRFAQLAQAMPQIVFIADARGKVQFFSDQWTATTGTSVESALGEGWMQRIHPDDVEQTMRDLRHTLVTGEHKPNEHRVMGKDGVYRWRLVRVTPGRDSSGNIVSYYGTSTDIDDLKQSEGALKRQSHLVSMAGQLARLGGWALDLPTMRFHWSDEASALLGLPPGSAPTLESALDLCAPHSRELAARVARECVEHGTAFDVEVEMHTADGRDICVRSIGQAVRDDKGAIVRMQGAMQDITSHVQLLARVKELNTGLEEKIAQRTVELARQEALFRTLAEQAPQPIWTIDPRGAANFFSRAWYELCGGAPPDWDGYAWVALVHPDDEPGMTQNWLASSKSLKPFVGTRRLRARSGIYHTMSYSASPVMNAGGDVLFWVGIDVDITELKAVETALRMSNSELEAFSYSVSHDLRSPLNTVDGFSRLLGKELGPSPGSKAQHYLARIQSGVSQMGQLIEGLLSLAHVTRLDLRHELVDLSAIAREVIDSLHSREPARHVDASIAPALAVRGDSRLLRSVMENLLGNAWKFSERRERARIEVGWSAEIGAFFVRDNGAGFDMAYAGKLFGTFQRLHGAAEFAGTGIGLATVARVIARHGGRIWAESAPDHGATFFFTLPTAR